MSTPATTTATGCGRCTATPPGAEGIWTGQRNFLRIFRGVSKTFLSGYVAIFEWGYNLKTVTNEFLRALLRPTPGTGVQT